MKALIVADLHYSLRQFDWLLRVAADYDVVVIAGDLLDIAADCELDVQIVVVMKYLALIRKQTRLIVCSGIMTATSRTRPTSSLRHGCRTSGKRACMSTARASI